MRPSDGSGLRAQPSDFLLRSSDLKRKEAVHATLRSTLQNSHSLNGSRFVSHNAAMTISAQPRNPLHGMTLERILTELVAYYGWPGLSKQIPIRCFSSDPSMASSLKFLRKTPWAREKVESLYLFMLREKKRNEGSSYQR